MVLSTGLPPLVVLAGGLGLRMGKYTGKLAKALLPVGGEPFLVTVLRGYRAAGITEAVLCSGHRAEQLQDAIGDGSALGLRVTHSVEPEPLGPIGALRHARPVLPGSYLLTYCDVVPTIDVRAFAAAARSSGRPMVMAVGRAPAPAEANVLLDGARVTAYAKDPPPPGAVACDRGLLAMERDLLTRHPGTTESVFYGSLARRGELGAFWTDAPAADIGTAHRYERHLRTGEK
ncbi:NTP transferase domain-containing protein [Streptomyces sp. CAU 1734]|uniref:NTP transferase domain-containing protein n=1 Tax=Streptomyces sp. CAU 1734 TaxID=3140360 RepID=UPI003261178D